MAFHLYEDTWETTLTTGAGDYLLGGAVAGWRPFSAQYADGDTTWYSAFDGVNFEHGIGTFHAPPTNTLTRGTVLRSTNGGAAVAWGAGIKQITVAPLGAMLEQVAPPISAQLLDLDPLRLATVGTKLKALGPLTSYNQVTASTTNVALDGAVNEYTGTGGDHIWTLPAATPGLCLAILLPNTTNICTIRPSGTDAIVAPTASFTNASPLVIPACLKGTQQLIVLSAAIVPPAQGIWTVISVMPEIAEAMGWVSRPYFKGSFGGGVSGFSPNTWTKNAMTMEVDSHGWWDAGNFRYVPKRPGRYLATHQALLGDNTSVSCIAVYAAVYIDGSSLDFKTIQWNGVNYLPVENSISVTTIGYCNGTTDYLEPYMFVAAAAPVVFGPGLSSFIVTYLGP